MKLLIVDDCVDIVKIMSSFLEMSDHQVDKAHNGIEAVDLLRNNSYDVVITDAEMPGMDGIELCKFIKSGFPAIYIIGTSGSFYSLDELRDAGADLCFSKPFHIDEVEKAIEKRFPSRRTDLDSQTGINDSCRLSERFLTAVSP
jgi:DNA-binding response OmpR family regulator